MSLIDAARHRIQSLFRPRAADREREDELRFHQDLATEHLTRETGAGADAPCAARRSLGNPTALREEMRHMGALRFVDATVQDLRFAWRTLGRAPVFTTVAVLSIGLGIGANTAIFSVINTLLLERLPVSNPRELALLVRATARDREPYFSVAELEALRTIPGVPVAAQTYVSTTSAEVGGETYDRLSFTAVDGSYFPLLGISAEVGRLITPDDDRAMAPVVVLGFATAVRHFGSARAAVGQTITLQHHVFTIVGVTPRRFLGLVLGDPLDFAVPRGAGIYLRNTWNPRDGSELMLLTRLGADSIRTRVAIERAFAVCCADGQAAASLQRFDERGQRILLTDISRGITGGKTDLREMFSRMLYTLMAGVAMILLIACTNVGNLLMGRAAARSRELAVRLSLGASRLRIVRQLLVESALLGVLGTVAGVLFALGGTAALAGRLPGILRVLQPYVAMEPNAAVLGFASSVAILGTALFGVLPALRGTRLDPVVGLRSGTPKATRTSRLDRGIVAFQMAVALVFVAAAGLLSATVRQLRTGLGVMDPTQLLIAQVEIAGTSIPPGAARQTYDEIERRLRRVPGVVSIAGTDVVPLIYRGFSSYLLDIPGFEDRAEDAVMTGVVYAGPGFFATMGTGLSAGREFGDADRVGAPPVAIVSEALAREFFPGKSAIGQMIRFRGGRDRPWQVVGVAHDVKQSDLRAPAPYTVYFSRAQRRIDGDRFVYAIRIDRSAAIVSPAVRAAIVAAAPAIAIRQLQPMAWHLALAVGREQALASLAMIFGALAVALAAIGLYGVMALHVTARTREIGVRMALGADRARVMRMILGQSLLLVIAGVVVGVPLALGAARALRALLYGVTPFEPAPFVLAVIVLVVVGLVATLLPSRKAAGIDPLVAMRSD